MKKQIRYMFWVAGLLASLCLAQGYLSSVEARPLSNNEVRRAVTSGQVVPFTVARNSARAYTRGGDVLRARLVSSGGVLRYRLRMLLPNGQVTIVFVNAHTGRVIGSK